MDKSEGPGCGAGGRRRDLDGIRTVTTNPTGVEGAGGIGGPGSGARGRRWGLDGIRTVTTNPTGVEDTGGIGGPGSGARGRRWGLDGIRTVTTNPTGVEDTGGIGGSGCGARGRRQGLAGLRDDAPSRRLAARTASGRAAAHGHAQQPGTPVGTHSSPAPRARKQPGTPVGHAQQPGPTGTQAARNSRRGTRETAGARSAAAPRAPHSRAAVAYRLSWMLRPGTASISSRV